MREVDKDRQIADLSTLLEVSRQLAGSTELVPLLRLVEEAARKVLDCERATLFLYSERTDELFSKVATGVEAIRFPARLGIAGEAARTRRIVNVADAYADARFNPEVDRQTGYTTRNLLTLPLLGAEERELIGVLQVLNKRGGPFTERDEGLAHTLGAQAGVVLQRQILIDEAAEKRRLEQELDIARDIQQALLPERDPDLPGFDIAGWNRPADRTGGDYYDFLELGGGLLALTVADATGHGIGPALVIAECRALMRAVASLSDQRPSQCDETRHAALPQMLERVNDLLFADLPSERFVTQFFGLLDAGCNRLSYVSAGQGPILFHRAADRSVRELPTTGLPLGMLPGSTYELGEVVTFDPGDTLLVLTDGFFEWADRRARLFGVEGVTDVLLRNVEAPARQLIEALYDAVRAYGSGVEQADDLTAVVVRRTG